MKEYITSKSFYTNNEELYSTLSDYISDNLEAPVVGTDIKLNVELQDCYIENGDFYAPSAYKQTYKGNGEPDDRDIYEPLYSIVPTLTAEQLKNINVF